LALLLPAAGVLFAGTVTLVLLLLLLLLPEAAVAMEDAFAAAGLFGSRRSMMFATAAVPDPGWMLPAGPAGPAAAAAFIAAALAAAPGVIPASVITFGLATGAGAGGLSLFPQGPEDTTCVP
jgi:hypothetical protein